MEPVLKISGGGASHGRRNRMCKGPEVGMCEACSSLYSWSEVSKGKVIVLRLHSALKGFLRTLACMVARWEPVREFDQGKTDLPCISKGPQAATLRIG